ncbi:hypothetical protein [Pseudovibrio ascidiaceicola]|jgi:hypothetical protein|nr:hypothetical protein [Pseudovibrio ascidiaceicola]
MGNNPLEHGGLRYKMLATITVIYWITATVKFKGSIHEGRD